MLLTSSPHVMASVAPRTDKTGEESGVRYGLGHRQRQMGALLLRNAIVLIDPVSGSRL